MVVRPLRLTAHSGRLNRQTTPNIPYGAMWPAARVADRRETTLATFSWGRMHRNGSGTHPT